MAVVDRNSTQISNLIDNTPSTRNDTFAADGDLRSALGSVANAADDTVASVHRAVRVPSNANIRSIKLTTGDATAAGAINLGVYYADDNPASDTGAVIDADLFASAFDLSLGPFEKTELAFESAVYTQALQIAPLWQAAGLTSDPGGYFDITATISTTYNGAAVGQLYEAVYVR